MVKRLPFVLAVVSALFVVGAVPAGAATVPSGERVLGQNGTEPVYNDETGSIGYFLVPGHAPDPVKANPVAWSPIYLPVYPVSAAASVGTLICMHTPVELPQPRRRHRGAGAVGDAERLRRRGARP